MRRNLLALAIASPWLVFACVRIFALDYHWPLIPQVALTPQVLGASVIPLAIALLLRARWAALGIFVVAAVLAVIIAPRAWSHDQPDPGGRSVTIFTANLLAGGAAPGPLIAAIRASDPDVIALQEATPANLGQLRDAGLLKDRPYLEGDPEFGTLGFFTVSRYPLHILPGAGGALDRWPEMRVVGTPLVFRNVHPAPPVTPGASGRWKATLSEIPGPRGRLRVVAGDFNATLDHRDFRAVLARGYADSGYMTGNGFKWTWSADRIRKLVIDHVLIPRSVRASNYRVFNLPGSDHNAVAVTLRLPR